jgi:UDP-N-acetyl-2-amino-2-deoxyglucuronate dehydrogenase
MEKKVRAGIIGCGNVSRHHALALAQLPETEFVACCDADIDRAKSRAQEYNVELVYSSAEEMLDSGEVDAVLVCTPHPSHGPLVVAAANAGVHVMVEKPMTISLAEADSMIAAAKKANIKFGVIFQRRFWPAAQRIRNAIDQGKLGNLTFGECSVRISST